MKRGDPVFFFTLVDFLLTTLFLGVVLWATSRAQDAKAGSRSIPTPGAIDSVLQLTGASNFAELTDQLTRLVPLRDAVEAVKAVNRLGGADTIGRMAELLARAGGLDSLERMVRDKPGAGKPHCLFMVDDQGRKTAIPIATLLATDSSMTVVEHGTVFSELLARLHLSYADVEVSSFAGFRRAFQTLRNDACQHTILLREVTDYKYARDAIAGLFYARLIR